MGTVEGGSISVGHWRKAIGCNCQARTIDVPFVGFDDSLRMEDWRSEINKKTDYCPIGFLCKRFEVVSDRDCSPIR